MKFYFFIALILISSFAFGQVFQKATITYLNGEVKKGFVLIPRKPTEKSIKYKLSRNISTEERIKSEELKYIVIESDEGNKYVLERIPIALKPRSKPTKPCWLLVKVAGYGTLYIGADYFVADNMGNVDVVAVGGGHSGPATFNYYLKKGNLDVAYYMGMTSPGGMLGLNALLRKTAEMNLSDYPELVERIKNKEFTHNDIPAIIMIYNDYMKGNTAIQHL
jgi:hypothetical protein